MTRPRIFITLAGTITILIALTSNNFTLIVTAAIIFLIALAHYLTVTPLGHDTEPTTRWHTPPPPYNQDTETDS